MLDRTDLTDPSDLTDSSDDRTDQSDLTDLSDHQQHRRIWVRRGLLQAEQLCNNREHSLARPRRSGRSMELRFE